MSKTHDNLMAAFTGESKARNRYAFYADVARREGYRYIARILEETAETGKPVYEPMRTMQPTLSWDEILIKGAQLAKLPLHSHETVVTETIIGPRAERPLVIATPIYVSHMSFGALSKEAKTALAMGSATMKTAICSGEGGILPEEMDHAHKYIFEFVPNQYSMTEENLRRADAIEIKIGQSAKPGMGGHFPGHKVTDVIARMTGNSDVHGLSISDLCTANSEVSGYTDIAHV